MFGEDDDNTLYAVVRNREEQYSIWPVERAPPQGWELVGTSGSKQECLTYVEQVWTDMRPLSLRLYMEAHPPSGNRPHPETK
jgi:MbtH protein